MITQLAKILMAVDHLEGFCKFKKLDYDRKDTKSQAGSLFYDAISKEIDEVRRRDFETISKSLFENYGDRTDYAV